MRSEPTVILEVDRRLAQFILSSRPAGSAAADTQSLARWRAAQEVRKILRDACPYAPGTQASHAWFVEKYGDAAGALMDE